MDQSSASKLSSDIESERVDGEEKPLSQDMFLNSLDVNGRTPSNSSSNSSLTNCSLNEERSNNIDLLVDSLNRYGESKDCETTRKLPVVNTPEKIILCVDICEDSDTTPFKIVNGTTYKPLYMIKRVIQIFVYNKQLLNKNHEFALVLLHSDNVLWCKNFTKDPRDITSVLDDLVEINSEPGEVFNLSDLFDEVYKHIHLPILKPANIAHPPYTVRMILFYCRSHCIPAFHSEEDHSKDLLSSDFFTIDVMYVHEDVSEQNKCQDIYSKLNELDEKGYSYVFHVARDATKLHNSMAKLLAHPLQRPLQKGACYVLPEPQVECG